MGCPAHCLQTILIESFYEAKDCMGNDYRLGYSNAMRLYGFFEQVGLNQETKERGETQFVYDRRIKEIWRMKLAKPLRSQSYLFKRLAKSVLLGRNITVTTNEGVFDGFIYKGNLSKLPDSVVNKDWFVFVDLEREYCRLTDNC
jgi:hypothetical protein